MLSIVEFFLSLPVVDQLGLTAVTAVQIACVSVIIVLVRRDFKGEIE